MVSEMGRMKSEAADGIGPVGAAVSLFGERIHGGKHSRDKAYVSFPEESTPSRTGELNLANRDIGSFSNHKRFVGSEKAQAESELSNTRKTVKELRSRIEESNSRAGVYKEELQLLNNSERLRGDRGLARGDAGESKYKELMQELGSLKKELSKLKVDMACTFEVKVNAEKETEASVLRAASYMKSVEELRKEIENVNEEHVLVEIARLEAIRETKEVEAKRQAEAEQFVKNLKETKSQIKEMIREVNQAKSLEQKLAATNADLNVLQSEMELVRATINNRSDSNALSKEESRRAEESKSDEPLHSIKAELEAAKKELVSVRDEGFQLMASMDAVREELKHISMEMARLKRLEEKQDLAVQNLNSKLLRAKFKMEVAIASEEKARAIVNNLSVALQQLQSEAKAAKKEKELIDKETEIIEMNIRKTDSDAGLAEQALGAAMRELERVKASEAAALDELKVLSQRARKARGSSAQHSSVIRISRFEYEYLIGHAEGAQNIADKKVAAARAWVEALKASEKEMLMKIEMAQREIRELEIVECKELNRMENSLSLEKALKSELSKYQEEGEAIAPSSKPVAGPRKSLKENGLPFASRRSRTWRKSSLSYGSRQFPRSPSITLRRKKVMPSLVKFLRGRRSGKQK